MVSTTTSPAVAERSSVELERGIAVITLAFAADPVMRWLFSEPGRYLRYFPALLRAFAGSKAILDSSSLQGSASLQVYDCAGAALWFPPNVRPDRVAVKGIMQEGVTPARQAEVFAFMERTAGYRPTAPYWWLPVIGVDPVHHHKGLGSALLRQALVRCDRDHMPAHLETGNPANVPLYERHGFKSLGTVQVGSSPAVFPMQRAAR
jgi:GNAT superfamily N-acetyltransferase